MEYLYSSGVDLIVYLQHRFSEYGGIFGVVNDLSDPKGHSRFLLPLVAAVDAPAAAQLVLVSSVCRWLNVLLKWILAEHRPYWWVRESGSVHADALQLTQQSCETGPGSPSGHLMLAAAYLTMLLLWLERRTEGRKETRMRMLRWCVWCAAAVTLLLASAARIFVAAHFPHQCALGIVCGILVALPLSAYMRGARVRSCRRMRLHVSCVIAAALLTLAVYWAIKWRGSDPQWSVKLAFKWCPRVEYVEVSSTPVYTTAHALSALLACALCITPQLFRSASARSRSSTVVTLCLGIAVHVGCERALRVIPSHRGAVLYYTLHAVLAAVRVALHLRAVPALTSAHARLGDALRGRVILEKTD